MRGAGSGANISHIVSQWQYFVARCLSAVSSVYTPSDLAKRVEVTATHVVALGQRISYCPWGRNTVCIGIKRK
jgi:hypothetical protein